jgi:putative sterol carrier protein
VFAAAAKAGVGRVVYTSSIAAYGVVHGHTLPLVEDSPRVHQRAFPYAAAKYEVEAWLDEFEPAHPELAIARIRPSIVVGAPTVHGHGAMLERRLLLDVGTPLPLVWDEDVAEVIALALRKGARGAFNVTGEPALDAATLGGACGLRVIRVPRALIAAGVALGDLTARLGLQEAIDPAWLRSTGVPISMSADKAKRELGWKPKCASPVDVINKFLAENASGMDRRLDLFFRMLSLAARRPIDQAAQMNGRIHLKLTGPGGGDVGLILDGARLRVIRENPRPPTTVVTMKATTLVELLAGRTEFTAAQLTGKVRVEGEALAALVVQAIVSRFRADTPKRLQRLLFPARHQRAA